MLRPQDRQARRLLLAFAGAGFPSGGGILSVERACGLHFGEVVHRPLADRHEWFAECLAERGEGVFDVGWDHVDHVSTDEAVGFHAAQGLGEHLLRDALDCAFELAVAAWAVEQCVDDQASPFVGEAFERLARLTVLIKHIGTDLSRCVHMQVLSVS